MELVLLQKSQVFCCNFTDCIQNRHLNLHVEAACWRAIIYRHPKNLTNIIIETRVDIHITVLKLLGNNKEIPFFFAISPFDRGTQLPCNATCHNDKKNAFWLTLEKRRKNRAIVNKVL